jgi:hypothetical protein
MRPRPFLLLIAGIALALMAAGDTDAEKEPEWETPTAGTVTGVAASADGELLAASYGSRVGLWNTSGPAPMEMWTRGPGVTSVAMSADGRQLAATEESNHRLTLWEDRVESWTYSGVLSFNSVAISADGSFIVAGDETYMYLFNRTSSDPLWSYNPSSAVVLVAISPDGERIAAATRSGNLLMWERGVSDPLWEYTDAAAISDLAFCLDGGWLAAATPGGALVFNSNSNNPALEYPTGTAFSAVAAHPEGELFAAGTEAGDIYLLDRVNGSAAWIRSLEGEIASLAFNGGGSHLLAGTAGKQLTLLATGNGEPLWIASTTAAVTEVATSWRGHWLLAGMENRLALYYEPVLDNQPPDATIVSIAPATAMPGWNVSFNGTGSDNDGTISAYQWNSSIDGELSTEANFSSSNLSLGRHTITFRVQDNEGLWGAEVSADVAIGDYPSAQILAVDPCPPQDECVLLQGTAVSFSGAGQKLTNGSANLTNFSWESDLDGVLSTVAEFSTTALSNGSHTITFRVGNEAGLWSPNTTFFLRLNGQPICLITEAPQQAVLGALVVLSGAGYDAEGEVVAYLWESSIDGNLSERDSFSSSDLSPGTHNVTLRVQDSDGAWSVPATRTLRILSPPIVLAICPYEGFVGQLLLFSANASDADGNIVLYEWDFNSPSGKLIGTPDFFDSAPEALKKYDLLPPNDAFYTAVVQVTDNDELQASDTCTIFMSEPVPPSASITSITPSPAEEGTTVVFSGTGSDSDGTILAYQWNSSIDGELSTEANFSSSNLSLGIHTITFRVQADSGKVQVPMVLWSDADSKSLYIGIAPVASANHWNDDNSAQPDTPVQFRGSASDEDGGIVLYEWDFNGDGEYDWSSADGGITSYSYVKSGSYNAVLRVTDNNGFTSTDTRAVHISSLGIDPVSLIKDNLVYILILFALIGGFVYWKNKADYTPPSKSSPVAPPPSARSAPMFSTSSPMTAIECPGCSAQMKVPALGKMQNVTCDSCGLSGEIEV